MAPVSRYMNRRARCGEAYAPTLCEHIANVTTHAVAVIPALFYYRKLLQMADDNQYKSALLYGGATLTLFVSSTAYHSVFLLGKWRVLRFYLHMIDRATIYIFIAASYTPWLSLKEMGFVGVHMRWLVWMLAFVGVMYQYLFHEKYKLLETILYVFTGIFPAVSVLSMQEATGWQIMAAGGLIYIIGVIFFKCDGLIPYAHAIWHLHVVIGAGFHYYAVYVYLMSQSTKALPENMPSPLLAT